MPPADALYGIVFFYRNKFDVAAVGLQIRPDGVNYILNLLLEGFSSPVSPQPHLSHIKFS